MCTRCCLFHPFLLLIFLSSLQAYAQRQDVRLSPSEIITYPLPQDAQIQSAARIGDITLVVWGTTVKRGDSVVNELRMQMLRGTTAIGAQRSVHLPEARPFGFVQVMSIGKEFLVLWNDRRDSVVATYMQRVDTTGERIGEEEKYHQGTITGLGLAQLRTASGRKRIFWSDSSSGAMRVYWREVDDSTNQLGPVLGSYPGLLVQVFVPDSIPGFALLMRRGELPLLVDSLGDMKELTGPAAEHFRLSYYLNDDGSIATINRDTLLLYRSLFDAQEYKRVVIPIPKYHVESGSDIGPLAPPFFVSRTTNGHYRIMYSSIRSFLVDPHYIANLNYIEIWAMDLTSPDTISSPVFLMQSGTRLVSGRLMNSSSLRTLTVVHGCNNASQLNYEVVEQSMPQIIYRDTLYIGEPGSVAVKDSRRGISEVFPDYCASFSEIRTVRVRSRTASKVWAVIGRDTAYLLTSIAPVSSSGTKFYEPGVMCRDGHMLVTSKSFADNAMSLIQHWKDGADSVIESDVLDYSVIIDSIPHPYPDPTVWEIDSLLRVPGAPAMSFINRWSEDLLEEGGLLASFGQFVLAYPTINGWKPSKKLRPSDVGYQPFDIKSYSTNPNSNVLLGAVTVPAHISLYKVYPRSTIFAVDSNGVEQWSIDSVFNTFDPFTVLPLNDREYLMISGSHALHMRERDTLGGFDLPSGTSNAAYDRLYGSYFLRRYFTTPSSLRLERYSLEGKLLDTGSVTFTVPPVDLFMSMNPADSSLAFLYGGSGGVRATLVDQGLRVHYADVPISVTRDSVRNPAGVYRNDTLFAVWEDYRNGKGAIYGTGYPADPITSSVRESGASESRDAIIQLLPNPSMGSVELVVNLAAAGEASVELIDARGDVAFMRHLGLLASGRHTIDLSFDGLPSGDYLVVVRIGNKVLRHRLIVVK